VNADLQNACSKLTDFAAMPTAQVASALQAPPPRWASVEDDEDIPEFMKECATQVFGETAPQGFQWPATRGPSLDEFDGAAMFCSLASLAAPSAAQMEGVPEMLMLGAAMQEFMEAKSSFLHENSIASDASTTISADEDQALTPPSGLSDDEVEAAKDTSATLKISLTDTLGLWSIGSAAHDSGTCKPCAFLWKDLKQPGCHHGRECQFCHLCLPGEVKRRKKEKMFMRKVQKYSAQFEPQYQNHGATGFEMW
jgi:hypothetical protein